MKRFDELHTKWRAMMAERKINVSYDEFLTIIDVADEHPKNPWVSADERLPDKWKRIKVTQGTGEECYAWVSKTVFVLAEGWEGSPEKAFYDFDANIWWSEYGDNIENLFGVSPDYWMPIPQAPK